MDIRKELENISQDNYYVTTVFNDIEKQEKELRKKKHLFKVINLVNIVNEMTNSNFFRDNGIITLKMNISYDYYDGHRVDFSLNDKNDQEVMFELHTVEANKKLNLWTAVHALNRFEEENVMQGLPDGFEKTFKLKPGIGNEFLDIFLSNELKSVLEFNKMQNSLPQNEIAAPKKPKL